MKIEDSLRAAAAVPQVPLWAGYVAGLAMAGAKIVPEDLWAAIGSWSNGEGADGEYPLYGFIREENHLRGEAHESWQDRLISEIREANPGKTVWVIPVDELSCLAANDEQWVDMVSLERLIFVGDEDALRKAVAKLIWRP